jgi:hypothetical protein
MRIAGLHGRHEARTYPVDDVHKCGYPLIAVRVHQFEGGVGKEMGKEDQGGSSITVFTGATLQIDEFQVAISPFSNDFEGSLLKRRGREVGKAQDLCEEVMLV